MCGQTLNSKSDLEQHSKDKQCSLNNAYQRKRNKSKSPSKEPAEKPKPKVRKPENPERIFKPRHLRIINWNVNSIRSQLKKDLVFPQIDNVREPVPDFVSLIETHLNSDVKLANKVCHQTKHHAKGGVL